MGDRRPPTADSGGPAPQCRVLVIDDNPGIHADFRKILSTGVPPDPTVAPLEEAIFGDSPRPQAAPECQVDVAAQGSDGLAMVVGAREAGRPYAVAFVDMRMPPGWDGATTVDRILDADPDIQIVICSAHSDVPWPEILERYLRVDRLLILRKPFDAEEVSQLVASLSQRWRSAALRRDEEAGAAERLRVSRMLDPLTGLPNRTVALEHLHSQGPPGRLGVVFLGIDRLRAVNDALGHGAGDELLRAFAGRLAAAASAWGDGRPQADLHVSRFAGDEFLVVVRDCGDEEVRQLAARLIAVGELPVPWLGGELRAGCSAGVAVGPAAEAGLLLQRGDVALFHAKLSGRGRVEVFDGRAHGVALAEWRLEGELRSALGSGALEVDYQPVVDLRTGGIHGFEALVRWRHPARGRVPPSEFIPLAERTGLVVELGSEVFRIAVRDLAAWREASPAFAGLRMAVNVSPRQVEQPELIREFSALCAAHGVSPADVDLEITESVVLDASPERLGVLASLRSEGFRVHLDDFGSGYCSLAYLRKLRVDALKIDKGFVQSLDEVDGTEPIVRAIIGLAESFRIDVVAEGIESARQLARLHDLGCHFAQGYHLARPWLSGDVLGNCLRWSTRSGG